MITKEQRDECVKVLKGMIDNASFDVQSWHIFEDRLKALSIAISALQQGVNGEISECHILTPGKELYIDLCNRLIKRILEFNPNEHDIELNLCGIILSAEKSKKQDVNREMLDTERLNWLDKHCSFVADGEYIIGSYKIGELRKMADDGIAIDKASAAICQAYEKGEL